ncbi:MAG: TrkH family potassium uptake protein [Candidatus Zixiibacteriota bacterium]|nr:MAG: TrkH family potassium uptake protein [candidate division Zixibacteria bacterium]
MNKRTVFYITGRLMIIMAGIMLIPFAISFYYNFPGKFAEVISDAEKLGFIIAVILSASCGFLLTRLFRSDKELEGIKEGFAVVSLGWVSLAFWGAIPLFVYFISLCDSFTVEKLILCFTNAYFETCSGFTTTGATILTDIEVVPKGLLFWRSLTHWLGGMGIITLAIAIFPAMGVSGYHMFRGEVPGPTAERIQPRLHQTAAVLWGVYALLSLIEAVLLLFGGMDWFDALCHTFGTMATGGFSTKNASIGYYNSNFIDWVIIIFMFFAGVNFLIHYHVLRGSLTDVRSNREFHFYVGTIVVTIVLFAGILYLAGIKPAHQAVSHYQYEPRLLEEFEDHVDAEGAKVSTPYGALRRATFQAVAIITTTGYGTADFDLWPNFCRFGLLFLMFWGGCAGSTGGGMKMIRILVVFKIGWRELKKMVRPHLVAPLKVGGISMDEQRVINIAAFFMLFVVIFVAASLLMTLFVPDLETAFATAAATLGNIGPGLGGIGSTQTYAWIPVPGKWILVICMLLGRLEIFTILLALRPSFWKK